MSNTLSSGIMVTARPQVMPRVLSLCALAALAVLQSTVINGIAVFNIKPDLLLIAAVITALDSSWKWALSFGLLAGLLKDISGCGSLGFYSLAFSGISFLSCELSRRLMIETRSRLLITVSLAVAVEYILLALYLAFTGEPVPPGILLRSMIVGCAYSAAFSPLVSVLFKSIRK